MLRRPKLHPSPASGVQLLNLFTQYFRKVKETYIRNNFTLIYELLDECCDFGVPQITEPSILKEYIYQQGTVKAERKRKATQSQVTLQVRALVAPVFSGCLV